MTKALDSFLRRRNVDVGHTFAVLGISSAVFQLFNVIGDAMVGKLNINLGIPVGIVVAAGLWEHQSWARKLILAISWFVSVLLFTFVVLALAGVQGPTLTMGTTVMKHPSPIQALIFGVTLLPLALFTLGALHSKKAQEEFGMPNQSKDPTA